ncbi:MAG: 50S ribosomal protein L23 [Candidatus Abawacabacteria bacterium RIFCSPHIGHO2_01_FULL_46_8]|uniref:50S ribosomal protein L23 n=1 Tax=Candidatus Abawacabacteria bacterium RIFCSPHIGHO2_01_FULL_46_8 TaxID=1817815 RepID=A0A1F4XMH7_9BACT|nr:MAG: 50S ribosomal protein L23 [Candidatus Abawacabacteria bacterium RIFCSPHIGHO2_01_FULL_46_8]
MLASHILKYPLVSEKAIGQEKAKKFVFVISGDANKGQVKDAFKQLYGILPKSVNIGYLPVKARSKDGAQKRDKQKKAIITIPANAKVDLQQVKEYRAKVK